MMEAALEHGAVGPRRWADRAAGLLFVALAACLAVAGVLLALGFRPLVVRSGSMEPAINTGDLIFTRTIEADQAEVGDVVTFKDPSRSADLVTHRVVGIQPQDSSLSFRTRGDANTGHEEWSVDADGRIGRYAFRVPRAGYVLSLISDPRVKMFLLIGGAALVAGVLLRKIWAA
jgi:signal peptidase I